MSCPGLIEAMRSNYPPHVRLVWQCLENHAHRVTRRWDMTDKAISVEMHLSTDSVSRAVAILERDGILQVTRRQWQASTFQMLRTYDKPAPLPADREPVAAPLPADSGAPAAPLPADSTAPLPADSVTHQVSNPPREESEGPRQSAPPTRGTRLPEDWTPGDTGRLFAIALNLDPQHTFDQFRDYWVAKPGQGGVKTDWPATWRNWCRNETKYSRQRARPQSAGQKFHADVDEMLVREGVLKPGEKATWDLFP